MAERYDLVIIGAGPGGYEAAIEAANKGMKTALVERRELGGTCLNRGCIPTKTMLHTAQLYRELENSREIGLSAESCTYDMNLVQERKEQVLEQLRGGIAALMKMHKIAVYNGSGTIINPVRVKADRVGEDSPIILETSRILIATGSVPALPPIPGIDLPGVVTSDELLSKREMFEHLVIIGGGVIGMEFASLYSSFGHKVTVIEALDRILANMDKEVSQNLKMIIKKRNVDIHAPARVDRIERAENGPLICRYTEKEKTCQVQADGILVAAGRSPFTKGLITEESADNVRSMKMQRGYICTDEYYQTSVPGIYAVGDVTGGVQLAHMATAQGRNAVAHMAGEPPSVDVSAIPGCVYTSPEIGCVGITADQAKEKGLEVIIKKYLMSANGKSVLSRQERGFIKVVADKESHRILGAQMMCARATDMVSQFAVAVVNQLTLEDMARVIFPHPTFSEGILEAVR